MRCRMMKVRLDVLHVSVKDVITADASATTVEANGAMDIAVMMMGGSNPPNPLSGQGRSRLQRLCSDTKGLHISIQ